MPHSVTEFIRFYNSPFSYWCNKTNKLVDEKKIDAKYKICDYFLNKDFF